MSAVGAFARVLRDDEVALRALFLWRFAEGFLPVTAIEIDGIIQFPVGQDAGAEVDDDAVFLDDARMDFRIDCAQPPADHLHHGRLVGTRACQNDARDGLSVEAFSQHCDVDDNLYVAELKIVQDLLALVLWCVACDDLGVDASFNESLADAFGMSDGGAEHDCLAVASEFCPLLNDGFVDDLLVHDRFDLIHVEV